MDVTLVVYLVPDLGTFKCFIFFCIFRYRVNVNNCIELLQENSQL